MIIIKKTTYNQKRKRETTKVIKHQNTKRKEKLQISGNIRIWYCQANR